MRKENLLTGLEKSTILQGESLNKLKSKFKRLVGDSLKERHEWVNEFTSHEDGDSKIIKSVVKLASSPPYMMIIEGIN